MFSIALPGVRPRTLEVITLIGLTDCSVHRARSKVVSVGIKPGTEDFAGMSSQLHNRSLKTRCPGPLIHAYQHQILQHLSVYTS